MSGIFLSYRRDDAAGWTGRLYEHLAREWGSDQVFMDIDAIAPGEDFRKAIARTMDTCDIVLVVIGPNWVTATDKAGNRRLDNASDTHRTEVAAALAADVRVVPVLVGGAAMPTVADLPEPLTDLAFLNAAIIEDRRFISDVAALQKALRQLVAAPSRTPTDGPARTTTAEDVHERPVEARDEFPTVRGPLDEAGQETFSWINRARHYVARATRTARDKVQTPTPPTRQRVPTTGGARAGRAPATQRPPEREPLPIRAIARIALTVTGAALLLLGTYQPWTDEIAGYGLTVQRFCESYQDKFSGGCSQLDDWAAQEPLAAAGLLTMILAAVALLGVFGKGGLARFAGIAAIVYVLAVVYAYGLGGASGGPQAGALLIIAGGICAFAGGLLARH
jgi:hypothetical protein